MTDKHVPASKLEELPTYCKTSVNGYMDSELVLRSKIRALIDEAPEVESVRCVYGEQIGMPEYSCASKCQYAPPTSPDLTNLVGELVEALDRYSGCSGRLSDKINALVTRAKEYLK